LNGCLDTVALPSRLPATTGRPWCSECHSSGLAAKFPPGGPVWRTPRLVGAETGWAQGQNGATVGRRGRRLGSRKSSSSTPTGHRLLALWKRHGKWHSCAEVVIGLREMASWGREWNVLWDGFGPPRAHRSSHAFLGYFVFRSSCPRCAPGHRGAQRLTNETRIPPLSLGCRRSSISARISPSVL
jgi:hypothetical protein